ncbi:MAG: alpha/beta hydrolase fold domain-containing protein [Candidatus Hydrogenedentales bacterium]|jgi:acetyl esterase/lipase
MKLFRKILKWAGLLFLLLLLGGVAFICIHGRAPAKRPDLVTAVPEGVPLPPRGYPSEWTSMGAGYFFYDLIAIENAPPLPGVVMDEDIQYGVGDDTPLFLDVYRSESQEGSAPGVLLFFGGGWRSGRKDQLRVYAQYFAQQGYVAATVQYRLREAGQWPKSIHDAKCAVRWMRAHAEEYGIDPERIGVMGNSAGAYLALMTGYTAGNPEFEGDGGWAEYKSDVQAVVDIYGPADFTEPKRRDHSLIVKYMNGVYEEDPQRFEAASPIRYVTAETPPTCIIHGTVDMLVPVTQSDMLAEKLIEKGVPYYYSRINGWPHAMDVVTSINNHAKALIVDFFDHYLKGEGEEVSPLEEESDAPEPAAAVIQD